VRATVLLVGIVALTFGYRWWNEQKLRRADVDQLQEVTSHEPSNGLAHYYLGLQLAEQGRPTAARELRQAVKLSPRDPRPQEALLVTLLEQGRSEEVRAELERARAAWPASPVVWLSQGRLAYREQDYPAAVEAFRKVTTLAPRERKGWYDLGRSLRETDQVTEASAAFRQALELDPRQPDTLAALGRCALDADQPTEAVPLLRRALAVNPEHAEANRYLAEALYQHVPDPVVLIEAKEAALRSVRSMPGVASAWFWLGQIYLRSGQTDQAISALQWALGLEPQNEATLGVLGELLLQRGRAAEGRALLVRQRRAAEFQEELRQLQQQSRREPENAALHVRLARLQSRAELWPAALREYEAGLRLTPGHPALLEERAEALAQFRKSHRVVPGLQP
jgi:Flp pilus assembly protein TadD